MKIEYFSIAVQEYIKQTEWWIYISKLEEDWIKFEKEINSDIEKNIDSGFVFIKKARLASVRRMIKKLVNKKKAYLFSIYEIKEEMHAAITEVVNKWSEEGWSPEMIKDRLEYRLKDKWNQLSPNEETEEKIEGE